ncbi:permease-like cell division protein FtsX [Streptosporangium sp. NBC_01495]|uniref:permease-like cell division protein FtsX n=1 Tax=Streptosporangium sp. NBC_01495 TaxID=2903899 RepID=UPI002E374F1E|nr:permease-like cell division protein FtsX [Streptosporangium sp. NBC_01495]
MMDEMNLLRDRAEAQPAPRPEAVASALDRLYGAAGEAEHGAAREPRPTARRLIRLPGSRRRLAATGPPSAPRRGSRPLPRIMAAIVVAATVVAVVVTTTVIARGPGEERPSTLAAMGDRPAWREGDPELVVFLCEDDSPFVGCGGGGFAVEDGGLGAPPDPILGGKATTPQDKAVIEQTLGAMPQVEAISFVSKQEAYADLLRKEEEQSILGPQQRKLSDILDVEKMKESYTLKMRPGTDWDAVIETAEALQGVANALNRKCLTENAQEIVERDRTLCAPGGNED